MRVLSSGNPLGGRHVQALDGLRGLAVLLVIVHHLNYTFPLNTMLPAGPMQHLLLSTVNNGWLGVDVFFVLSGFLITGILLKSRQATNYYGAFYVRRLLRIAPLYLLVLLFCFASPWPDSALPTHASLGTQVWWWLNASNLRTAWAPGMLAVVSLYWSLAVEEQFYLMWPWVLRRVSGRLLVGLTLGGVGLEMVVRVLPPMLRLAKPFPEAMYRLTPLHCDGLLLGAAMAVALREGFVTARALPWLRGVAAGGALATVFLLHIGLRFYTTPVAALAATALVGWLTLRKGEGVVSAVLACRPLRLCGRYSYCMYVTQTLVLVFAGEHLLQWWAPAVGWARLGYCYGVVVLALFGVGAASWRWFEGPLNARKEHFPYRFAPVMDAAGQRAGKSDDVATTLAA